jgi:cytochrome d ubiquinol oxidase subunit II
MTAVDLNTVWFVLVGVLLTGYAVLDGFDLGTGPLLFATRDDRERRLMLNAIGPIWDGNEVWLVTGGGALFAAFPIVYATVFSGFYDAFMLLLVALIFRAAAIELRSQRPGRVWRTTWDAAFAVSSLVSAFLIGVALGNVVYGIPLDANHEFQGNLLTLLHPYALLVGVTAVALLVMHANLYLILKTDGPLQQRLARLTRITVPAYLAAFLVLNAWTMFGCPHVAAALHRRPLALAGLFVAAVLLAVVIRREVRRQHEGRAFAASCLSIVTLMLLVGVAIYPVLVFSTPQLAHSLNIYNGAATEMSLRFMATVAFLGVPLVLAYTATIYWVFRGKVVLTDESY